MAKSSEDKPSQRQVNIRIDESLYERLRAWAYIEQGDSHVGVFVVELVTRLTEEAALANPNIDELVRLSAEARQKEQ